MQFIKSIVLRSVFSFSLIDIRPGYISFKVSGKDAWEKFKNEAGGHRVQRVPPTEKRGRRQTSTITVAVLKEPTNFEIQIDPKDLEIKTCRGSGAGGQHRNVTESAVQITHKPTKLTIRCENDRSQHTNKANAMFLLRAKLFEQKQNNLLENQNKKRKQQVGMGMRGDKIRTIRAQDNIVINHITGKRIKLDQYLKGELSRLNK